MRATLEDIEVEVEANYCPPIRGSRGSYGEPLEPDEPERMEITDVTFGGVSIKHALSGDELDDIEQQLLEEYGEA